MSIRTDINGNEVELGDLVCCFDQSGNDISTSYTGIVHMKESDPTVYVGQCKLAISCAEHVEIIEKNCQQGLSLEGFTQLANAHRFDVSETEATLAFDFNSTKEAEAFESKFKFLDEVNISISDESYPDDEENEEDCWVVATIHIFYSDFEHLLQEQAEKLFNNIEKQI